MALMLRKKPIFVLTAETQRLLAAAPRMSSTIDLFVEAVESAPKSARVNFYPAILGESLSPIR
jgi:hypothetical protein